MYLAEQGYYSNAIVNISGAHLVAWKHSQLESSNKMISALLKLCFDSFGRDGISAWYNNKATHPQKAKIQSSQGTSARTGS